jgi:hypothetical protein
MQNANVQCKMKNENTALARPHFSFCISYFAFCIRLAPVDTTEGRT